MYSASRLFLAMSIAEFQKIASFDATSNFDRKSAYFGIKWQKLKENFSNFLKFFKENLFNLTEKSKKPLKN